MTRLRRASVIVALSLLASELVPPAAAQKTDFEIMSKADAIMLFKMPRQQWQQNVASAVAAGKATATGFQSNIIGMRIAAPPDPYGCGKGWITTRLDYRNGDARPAAVEVDVAWPPGEGPSLADSLAKEAIATVERQMAPEFEVIGNFERLAGGQAFFFIITETKRHDPRGPKGK